MSGTKINFLTWNLNSITSFYKTRALLEILSENDIDILILQESYNPRLKNILASKYDEILYNVGATTNGVRIFCLKNKFEQTIGIKAFRNKLVMISFCLKGDKKWFNVFAVHLYSKVGNTERMQMWGNKPILSKIFEFEESSRGQYRSILVGDFNNNPYEANLIDPSLLNTKENRALISLQQGFATDNDRHNFWYNPMWNFLGDYDNVVKGRRVNGTFYFNRIDEQTNWHLFDGFLVRPELMDDIAFDSCKIITETKTKKFLKSMIIREDESLIVDHFSDHLPFTFSINI